LIATAFIDSHFIRHHTHGLTVKETPFEFFEPHNVVDVGPIAPEKVVPPPSGGLNTNTNTVPGCAMSAAVTAELSLLLGGVDLTKTKHKRWYRKAPPEGHATA